MAAAKKSRLGFVVMAIINRPVKKLGILNLVSRKVTNTVYHMLFVSQQLLMWRCMKI
jgi:hypothetical protein